ncbi:invasion associated locus B family protein [Methyloraptor flagellatus]|uniref:Invasion associated locus B family protein n=2 Tax=Methyloraptor flagellatus TaxID=3162530 RepID=A0AAU7X918_9HYPH
MNGTRALVVALIALVVVIIGALIAFMMFGGPSRPAGSGADSAQTDPRPAAQGGGQAGTAAVVNQADRPGLGPVKSQHGDWQIRCNTPPGARAEQCALIQNVTAEDRPNVGLSVIVLKTSDKKTRILRVLAPLGVLIPSGLGLKIDAADIGRTPFVRCLPNGCIAEVVIDDTLMGQLRTGTTATFSIFQTPEEGIGIPISLASFGEGFDKLP